MREVSENFLRPSQSAGQTRGAMASRRVPFYERRYPIKPNTPQPKTETAEEIKPD